MFAFALILIAATPTAPVKCDAKPFTLAKPATATKTASVKEAQPKAEPPKPIMKPNCNHPGHNQPGQKH